jgi:hypothetical protein
MFILFADMESNDGEELDFEPSNVEAGGSGTAVPDNTSDTTMQVPVLYSSINLVREFSHETESRIAVEFYYSSLTTLPTQLYRYRSGTPQLT